jgi:hypothetical protein
MAAVPGGGGGDGEGKPNLGPDGLGWVASSSASSSSRLRHALQVCLGSSCSTRVSGTSVLGMVAAAVSSTEGGRPEFFG